MKKYIIKKSVVLLGNVALLATILIILGIVIETNVLIKIFCGLLTITTTTLFTVYMCSIKKNDNHKALISSLILTTLTWIYSIIFLIIIFIFSINVIRNGFNATIVSSTQKALFSLYKFPTKHRLSIEQPKSTATTLTSKSNLLWDNSRLTLKILLSEDNHKLRTMDLVNYKVSFFNYKTLHFLFQEIFLENGYYFSTNNNKPFIIDCGSNIGMSMLYFKKLYPHSRIMCFEPDPSTFKLLEMNKTQNNLNNVQLINKAVSNKNGTISFYSNGDNTGGLGMSTNEKRGGHHEQKIEATTLSQFITTTVDFLKMDIEGSETVVIQELAEQNKLHLIKQMIIEFHHHIPQNDTDDLSVILKTLEDNGFSYQIQSSARFPFRKNIYQDILIYAYQKN